jgi:hypothetical protein
MLAAGAKGDPMKGRNDVRNLDPYRALRANKEQSLSAVEDEGGVPTVSQNGESVNDQKTIKNVEPQKEEQKPHNFSAAGNEGGLRLSRLPQRTLRTAVGHGDGVVTTSAVAHEGGRRYDARLLRYVMNRVALALAIVAMLPIFACRHFIVVQAQNDPLNNSYKPSVDCNPADYPPNIALSGPMVKLRQDSGTPGGVYGAAPCITVMATQNEFQSFQVHVQGPSGGYSSLSVTVSALTKSNGPGNTFTIPAPSTSSNDIVVYREGYIHITTPSCLDAPTCLGTASSPTGYYPDPLVPAIDPYWHQTTAAFPVNVAAGQNQSAWIDVYIPQTAPSGWYSGTVTITNGGATIATLPVVYGVWQWPSSAGGYMPSTPTLQSAEYIGNPQAVFCNKAYGTSSCASYPGANGNSDLGAEYVNDDLAVQLMDNRLSLSDWNLDYSLATYEGWLESGATAPSGRPNRIMPGSKRGLVTEGPGGQMCGGGCNYGTPGTGSNAQTAYTTYMGWFTANSWPVVGPPNGIADYLADEPGTNCTNWANVNAKATNAHQYTTPIMPELITAWIQAIDSCNSSYENDVDIMVVPDTAMEPSPQNATPLTTAGTNYRSSYNTWLSGKCCSGNGPTRQVWEYGSCSNTGTCTSGWVPYGDANPPHICNPWPSGTGYCPPAAFYENWDVDGAPVANRIEAWETWHNNAAGQLYYMLDGCMWSNNNCGTEPWNSLYDDGNNGDGDLLYYGTNSTHNGSAGGAFVNVSTPIWIPSIRLKMMRDGMEDYEYLHLLSSLGGPYATVANSAYSSWIKNLYTYNTNPISGGSMSNLNGTFTFTGDLTDARYQLGEAVHEITYPVTVLPPATVTPTLQP